MNSPKKTSQTKSNVGKAKKKTLRDLTAPEKSSDKIRAGGGNQTSGWNRIKNPPPE